MSCCGERPKLLAAERFTASGGKYPRDGNVANEGSQLRLSAQKSSLHHGCTAMLFRLSGLCPSSVSLTRPAFYGASAYDGPHGQPFTLWRTAIKKGESPHGPPLHMSGELFMDCEPATHPFMSRKSDAFRLTSALQCYTACPGCVFSGSAAFRPQGQKTPVYCCGPSGTLCTKAKAIRADDIRGRCAGFCSCCRTNPAMSIAIPASVIAERLAFLLSSSTVRYRCIRARSCSS